MHENARFGQRAEKGLPGGAHSLKRRGRVQSCRDGEEAAKSHDDRTGAITSPWKETAAGLMPAKREKQQHHQAAEQDTIGPIRKIKVVLVL